MGQKGAPVPNYRPTTSQGYPRKLEDVTPPCISEVFLYLPQDLLKTVCQNEAQKHRFNVLGLCWCEDAGWIIPTLVPEVIVKKEHRDSWEHPGSFQTCGRSEAGSPSVEKHFLTGTHERHEHGTVTGRDLIPESQITHLWQTLRGNRNGISTFTRHWHIWSVEKVHLLNPARKVRPKGTFPVNFY